MNNSNLCQAGDGSYLRVEVSAVWKFVDHYGAGVVQQGLLVNRVLHLWDFLQVTQLKAFSLHIHTQQHTQKEGQKQLSEINNQEPRLENQIAMNFLSGTVRKRDSMECAE